MEMTKCLKFREIDICRHLRGETSSKERCKLQCEFLFVKLLVELIIQNFHIVEYSELHRFSYGENKRAKFLQLYGTATCSFINILEER